MLPELSEIKNRRKRFGMTQTELSLKTGVSQSLIAKIEAASIVPSYSNAKRIFDFFEAIHNSYEAKARDFMTARIIAVAPNAKIREAVRLMEKHSVSQLPVLLESKNVGTLSEKAVVEQLHGKDDSREMLEKSVEEIMEDAMPQISEETPFEVVSSMLGHSPGALVTKKGRIVGIVTKSDLLKAVVAKRH